MRRLVPSVDVDALAQVVTRASRGRTALRRMRLAALQEVREATHHAMHTARREILLLAPAVRAGS